MEEGRKRQAGQVQQHGEDMRKALVDHFGKEEKVLVKLELEHKLELEREHKLELMKLRDQRNLM